MQTSPLIERELRATARRPVFYWLRALIVLVAALKGIELFERYAASVNTPPRWTAAPVPPGVMVLPPGALAANYSFTFGNPPPSTNASSITNTQSPVPSVVPLATPSNMLTLVPGGGVTNVTVTMAAAGPPMIRTAPRMLGPALLHDLAGVVFLIALALGLVTADSISREKREGTLRLLILSNLSTRQIVAGKLTAHGLTGFTALLAFAPVSMIAILAGGVTFAQAALTAAGLLSVLFVSLSAGLLVSVLFRERRHVLVAAALFITFIAFGIGLADRAFGNLLASLSLGDALPLLGLTGWKAAAGTAAERWQVFLPWFLLTILLGLSFFWLAAWSLSRRWQDGPHKHIRDLERVEASAQPGWVLGEDVKEAFVRPSLLTNPRPWDANPIRWHVERLGNAESLVWLPMLVSFLAQYGLLGAISSQGSGDIELLSILASTAFAFVLGSGCFLAWAGSRFFLQARSRQDLEMLLTTEIGGREILRGQWAMLKQAIAVPCAVLGIIALPATLVVISGAFQRDTGTVEYLLPLILMAANLMLETLAIFWVGMWFGLVARNAPVAVSATAGLVQLAPMCGVLGAITGWQWLDTNVGSAAGATLSHSVIEFTIVSFLLAKNAALILWARGRLRRELRLGGRRGHNTKSAPQLIPQTA